MSGLKTLLMGSKKVFLQFIQHHSFFCYSQIVKWENVLKAAAVVKKCLLADVPKPKIRSYLENKGVNKMEIKAAVALHRDHPDQIPTIQQLIVCH